MSNAYRDENDVPTLIASSSSDGKTPVRVWADPDTHRLLVDNATTGSNFADGETPSGAVNGVNVTFTLAHTPNPSASLQFFVNGQLQAPVGVDFTLSTDTITVNIAPPTDSILLAWYRY